MVDGISRPPYYDLEKTDTKNIQVLFRPGVPLQARELTELQTVIANQIERMGRHLLKEGSPVTGGALSLARCHAVFVDVPTDRSIEEFKGKTVKFRDENGDEVASGVCELVAEATPEHPGVLGLSFVSKEKPEPGHIAYVDEPGGIFAPVSDRPDAVHRSLYAHLQDGVYFLGGRFVVVEQQLAFVDPVSIYPSGWVGLVWEEKIITPAEDPSLLDPALGLSNYGSEGAHRLAAETRLHFVKEGEQNPPNFVPLMKVIQGEPENRPVRPVHAEIGKMIARRTYEESGDYTVKPYKPNFHDVFPLYAAEVWIGDNGVRSRVKFRTTIPHELSVGDEVSIIGIRGFDADGNITDGNDPTINRIVSVSEVVDDFHFVVSLDTDPAPELPSHIIPGISPHTTPVIVAPLDDMMLEISEGSAYVKGFEIDHLSKQKLRYPRARDTEITEATIRTSVGNVVYLTNVQGYLDPVASNVALQDASGNTIAVARATNFRHVSGNYASDGLWQVSLFDIQQSSGTNSLVDVRKVSSPNFSADVHQDSIVNNKFVLKETKANKLLYRLGFPAVKTLLPTDTSEFSFTVWRKYTGTANGTTVTFFASGDEMFVGDTVDFAGTSTWNQFYVLVNNNTNQITNPTSVVIGTGYNDITCEVNSNDTFTLLAAVRMDRKIRSKVMEVVDVAIPRSHWDTNDRFYLGFADAISVVAAYDSGTPGTAATDQDELYGNVSLTSNKTPFAYLESYVEVGGVKPKGDLLLKVRRYTHSGEGPFVRDSYTGHRIEEIPVEEHGGVEYPLANCVDWRPVILNSGVQGDVPVKGSLMEMDVEVYLNRADLVVLDSKGIVQKIYGEPTIEGFKLPQKPEDAMTLFEVYLPAYTFNSSGVKVKVLDNRRYTMRDIGRIDKRLERVEYYTQLSLLEMRVKSEPVYDKDGKERFKNGFIVDDFSGDGIGWTTHAEFKAFILSDFNQCRCMFVRKNEKLMLTNEPTHTRKHGSDENPVFTLPYEEVPFLENLNPTKKEWVTPYLVSTYVGKLFCDPDADDWYEDSHETNRIEIEMEPIEVTQNITVDVQR